jgi:serine/threonine protein phosphatase PrpC
VQKSRATEIREKSALSKQLRLDVAQLTDVGRKRPHNEDNMAYVIPKDPQVMARKGALFIVADGMGGHAAGEVASEIAVDTVSKVYYQDDSDDVAVSLLHAIRRANALIHQRAAENMMRSGMGTTCVAAVLRGSIAYIANVGDSRAYLIRKEQVKQISQDHSWVEEQVRAGLLTRDQARSHAQRNVITRCLGTQPEVEIDVFSERLEESDTLILCSDGLSGLVADEELQTIVARYLPQESVYHLVERANENGGSDNITAVVVRVQELGWDPPSASIPQTVTVGGGLAIDEDTALIGQFRGSPLGALPVHPNDGHIVSGPLRMASGPLVSSKSATAPQPAVRRSLSRRSRLLYPTLAIFLILVVTLIGGGAYYLFDLYRIQVDVDTSLATATSLIQRANAGVANNPGEALRNLKEAQENLRKVQLKSSSLSEAQRKRLTTLLQGEFTSSVKNAIATYNKQEAILPPFCAPTQPVSVKSGNTETSPEGLIAVRNGKGKTFFALGADHSLYQVIDQDKQKSLAKRIPLPGNAQAVSMAATDNHLLVLAHRPAQDKNPEGYMLALVGSDGNVKNTTSIDSALLKNGPKMLVSAWDREVFVALASQNAPGTADILNYALDGENIKSPPRKATISVSNKLVSMTAFPNKQLFLLFDGGDVHTLQFREGDQTSVSVVLQQQEAIPTPLAVGEQEYTYETAVPTPNPQQSSSLSVLSLPGATLLAAGKGANNTSHLYIGDDRYHRVLDLVLAGSTTGAVTPTPSSTKTGTGGGVAPPVKMQLFKQFASAKELTRLKSLASDPTTVTLFLLTQGAQGDDAAHLVSIEPGKTETTACPAV